MRASVFAFGAAVFVAEVAVEWMLAVLATPGALAAAAAHATKTTPEGDHQ